METRKLIKFGSNSFVISLPHEWIETNKLVKGAELYLDEKPGSITVTPSAFATELKHAYLPCDGKTLQDLEIELLGYYKTNYSTFTIEGKTLPEHTAALKTLLSNLSGVEIIEQHRTKIVAKDLLDVRQVTLPVLITRMDMMIRSMFQDALGDEEVPPEVLRERDRDVNRLHLLVSRTVRGVYESPALGNVLDVTPLDASYIGQVAWILERVADYIKRIDGDMLRSGKNDRVVIKRLLKISFEHYLLTMKAYAKGDAELAVKTHADVLTQLTELTRHVHASTKKDTLLALENIKNVHRDLRIILRATIERPDVFFKDQERPRVG